MSMTACSGRSGLKRNHLLRLVQFAAAAASFTAVCAAGYGSTNATGNATVDCATLCPYGYYGDGDSTSCGKCPDTIFNHEVGNAIQSYGVTFYKGLPGPETCVPRFSQLANPAGHIMSVDDSMFNTTANVTRENCIKTCPSAACCINQFEAIDRSNEEIGTCKTFIMPPVGPDSTTGKLYYKLPPSELIAAGSVSIKTQSSSIYARCGLTTTESNMAANGMVGTSPFPDDIEKDKTFVRWNESRCNSEVTCEATCSNLATCWGYMFVPGKGYAIRGGEMQLGFRTFFAVPDATLATSLAMETLLWGKPTQ